MNGAMLLQHAVGVIEHRERVYGPPTENFAAVAARWSLVLGITVTPAQVALCLIDLIASRLDRRRRRIRRMPPGGDPCVARCADR